MPALYHRLLRPVIHQDKAEAQRKAARQAQALVAVAQCKSGNAYLSAKGWPEAETLTLHGQPLRVGGITYHPGDLLLPLHNAGGEVVNVQLINASGDKRMLAGGQVKAACHTLCGLDNAVIWLTEGYATGLTVHRLTGETVCVALSANNLAAVAEQLRSHYPDARLLLAADNDPAAPGRPAPPRRPHAPAVFRHCRPQKAIGTTSTVIRVLRPRACSSGVQPTAAAQPVRHAE